MKTLKQQLAALGEAFPCVESDCDQHGNIPHQVGDHQWEPEQCYFCYEVRFPVLKQAEKSLKKWRKLNENT